MPPAESPEPVKGPPRLGSYRMIEPLGSGGMSSVFKAVHEESGHVVAVKVLPRALAKNPVLLQRFLREAKNAEALEHPYIASIYDRGFAEGRHYLVLEYVEGGDLHERVRRDGPLPVAVAVRAIREVAEGLKYASGRGVIHRDVKPANLLMTPSGKIKIIDLGLALQAENEDERVTRDGTTVGTVDYMAPEQARDSRATSERSDIYSLGCTLYFLLTGSPPFPGGDIVDKLGRHCTAPIPDAKSVRPEVSVDLNLLIKRMMAKKPTDRYADYDALIAAVAALPGTGATTPPGVALDVLIDDEPLGLVPPETLDVLLADDDDEILVEDPAPAEKGRPAPPKSPRPSPPRIDAPRLEVSLADLAAIEDDAPPIRNRLRTSAAGPAFRDDPGSDVPEFVSSGGRHADLPLKTWIAAGAILGLAIALLGYASMQLLGPSTSDPFAVDEAAASRPNDPEPEAEIPVVSAQATVNLPKPGKSALPPPTKLSPPDPVAWVEPAEPQTVSAAEPPLSAGAESTAMPAWARSPIGANMEGAIATVRRAGEAAEVATIRQAFDKNPTIVEIADNGPFFEDDLRVGSKTRLIRARPGFRPILKVEASNLAIVRDRPAVITLDGADLTLDGLDIVVDVGVLPPSKLSLLLLRSANLVMHRCTVTVVNRSGRGFALARVEAPTDQRPNRSSTIRLDSSRVVGTSGSVIELGAAGEVAVSRSILIHGSGGVVVERSSTERGDRAAWFFRSIVATRGAAIEVPGVRAVTMQVRATATTFAKIAGVEASAMIRAKAELADPVGSVLTWSGEGNSYLGWPAWMTAGDRPNVIAQGLAVVESTWRSAETRSRESNRFWPGSILDESHPTSLRALPDAPTSIIDRAATASPDLIPATVGRFERQPIPAIPGRVVARGPEPGRMDFRGPEAGIAGVTASRADNASRATLTDPRTRSAASQTASPSPTAANGPLTFSLSDPTFRGDLGRFLRERVGPAATPTVVTIEGEGSWAISPAKLPAGTNVTIRSNSGAGHGPTFYPASGSLAPALLSVTGGDLSIEGINLINSSAARVARLVLVEDGSLLVQRCSLYAADAAATAGAGLVGFRSSGTRPFPIGRRGPFTTAVDRPTCVVVDSLLRVGGGEAIAAEIGRGVVSLLNCVVIAEGEGVAFALRPQKVASDRFAADLDLDHCTLAAEGDFVRIDAWPGTTTSPARPWLVSSEKSAFIEIPRRGRRSAVLLRSIREALWHGAINWQATGDAYDLVYFLASGDGPPSAGRARPDVKASWVDVWGAGHIVGVLGPNPRRTDPVLTIPGRDRLRTGSVSSDALALDPKAHPDLGARLDLIQTGAKSPRAATGALAP